MLITKELLIGEVVAMDYRTASVFRIAGIDFCCNGNRTIGSACEEAKTSDEEFIQQLQKVVDTQSKTEIDARTWPVDLLATYIERVHHVYVRTKARDIEPYLTKICSVHGDRHPELIEVKQLFNESVEDLEVHMKNEEEVLFPYIKAMATAELFSETDNKLSIAHNKPSLSQFHKEHNTEGERFRKIAALTNGYAVPSDGCGTYKVTLAMLRDFEEDLHRHIHLENNVLFPQAGLS